MKPITNIHPGEVLLEEFLKPFPNSQWHCIRQLAEFLLAFP
jgi:hypothetical protein